MVIETHLAGTTSSERLAVKTSESSNAISQISIGRLGSGLPWRALLLFAFCVLLVAVTACAPQSDIEVLPPGARSGGKAFARGPFFTNARFEFAGKPDLRRSTNFWLTAGEQMKVQWDSLVLEISLDPVNENCNFDPAQPCNREGFQNTNKCKCCDACFSESACGLVIPELAPRLLTASEFIGAAPGMPVEVPGLLTNGCSSKGGAIYTPSQSGSYALLPPAGTTSEQDLANAKIFVVNAGTTTDVVYKLTPHIFGDLVLLREDRLTNSATLASLLRGGRTRTGKIFRDGVCSYLNGRLAQTTRDLLEGYTGGTPSLALVRALTNDLNDVISGTSIFDATRFDRIRLSEETRFLLTQTLTGNDLHRLNRLLLEETFPSELPRLPIWFVGSVPGDDVIQDNFSDSLLVTEVHFMKGDPARNPATGLFDLVNTADLRPSRLILISGVAELRDTLNDQDRCYANPADTDSVIDLQKCSRTRGSQGQRLDMTPAYLYSNRSQRLTWVAEFNVTDGASRPFLDQKVAGIRFTIK